MSLKPGRLNTNSKFPRCSLISIRICLLTCQHSWLQPTFFTSIKYRCMVRPNFNVYFFFCIVCTSRNASLQWNLLNYTCQWPVQRCIQSFINVMFFTQVAIDSWTKQMKTVSTFSDYNSIFVCISNLNICWVSNYCVIWRGLLEHRVQILMCYFIKIQGIRRMLR